jgi:hypothetical protein
MMTIFLTQLVPQYFSPVWNIQSPPVQFPVFILTLPPPLPLTLVDYSGGRRVRILATEMMSQMQTTSDPTT